jgi:hypothetical protein
MSDFIEHPTSDTGATKSSQALPRIEVETSVPDSTFPELSPLLDLQQDAAARPTGVDENYINQKRMLQLRREFTSQLISLILESNFEYGVETEVDLVVHNQMKVNALATRNWLNDIFVENFANPAVLSGLLRTIARFHYMDVYPEGQTMAIAALSHANVEVQECGVRAFEHWGSLLSLDILENLKVSTPWLQEYIDEAVKDLRKEHNVSVS